MSTENEPPEDGPYDVASDPSSERAAETGEREPGRRARGGGGPREPEEQEAVGEPAGQRRSDNMLPQRPRRPLVLERLLVRLIATGGVIAVGVAIAAIMVSSHSKGWIVGLVVSIVSVVLSAILWSSRQL